MAQAMGAHGCVAASRRLGVGDREMATGRSHCRCLHQAGRLWYVSLFYYREAKQKPPPDYFTGAYHSRFAVIPDYHVGVIVLTAGSGDVPAQAALFQTVLTDLIPGLDATARAQAEVNLAGKYAAPSSEVNTTITLTTEPSLPGLKITQFISNSTGVINTLFAATRKYPKPDVRLYPTELVRKTDNGTTIRKYNAVINNPDAKYPNSLIEALNCVAWEQVDLSVYGAVGYDEVWIETDGSGKAVGVELRAFGARMVPVEQ